MSLVRLNIKSRIELETRVLAAALKQSFERGDTAGVSLAHKQLFLLLKDAQKPNGDQQGEAIVHVGSRPAPATPPTLESVAPPKAVMPEPVAAEPPRAVEVHSNDMPEPEPEPESEPEPEPESEPEPIEELHAPPQGLIDAEVSQQDDDEEEQAPMQFAPPTQNHEADRWRRPDDAPPSREPAQPWTTSSQSPEVESQHTTPVNPQYSQAQFAAASFARQHDEPPEWHVETVATPSVPQPPRPSESPTDTTEKPVFEGDELTLDEEPSEVADNEFPAGEPVVLEEEEEEEEPQEVPPDTEPQVPETSAQAQRAFLELAAMMGEADLPEEPITLVPVKREVKPQDPFKRSSTREMQEPKRAQAPKEPEKEAANIYELLGVSQMSPFEDIHRNFLRKVRRILQDIASEGRSFAQLNMLRKIWIAHDILTDPVTRTDYDFRDMGLRGDDAVVAHAPEDRQQARMNNRTPLRIGELLQCAGLLETAELEIACDMHKAMPEMQFGAFLVRQGFIQPRELESVLLGQKLLREGLITVAQFQVAMDLSGSRGSPINETLLERGYIEQSELEKFIEPPSHEFDDMLPPQPPQPPPPPIKEIVVPAEEAEPLPSAEIDVSSALPTWKDQLDWTQPEADKSKPTEHKSLGALLSGIGDTTPRQPEEESEADSEQVTLRISDALPSWKDQLDWNAPANEGDEPESGASNGDDGDAARQAEADSEGGEPTTEQIETEEADEQQNEDYEQQGHGEDAPPPQLKLGNAVPSWKDQLDWSAPEEDEEQQQSKSEHRQEDVEHATDQIQANDESWQESAHEGTSSGTDWSGGSDRYARENANEESNFRRGDTLDLPPAETIEQMMGIGIEDIEIDTHDDDDADSRSHTQEIDEGDKRGDKKFRGKDRRKKPRK